MTDTYVRERILKSSQASVDHTWNLDSELRSKEEIVSLRAHGDGVEILDCYSKGHTIYIGLLGGPGRVVCRVTTSFGRLIDKESFVEIMAVENLPIKTLE